MISKIHVIFAIFLYNILIKGAYVPKIELNTTKYIDRNLAFTFLILQFW